MNAEVEQRTQAFRRQLTEWVAAERPGVPFLALPGVVVAPGSCVSCGGRRQDGLRCAACLDAVAAALGGSPANHEGERGWEPRK